ncbi:MAG: argininosuccinate lyase [Alphaproteobacteria bacterium]|nr:argininosuccinate lyase [Alphaproteobacteria bacterium]
MRNALALFCGLVAFGLGQIAHAQGKQDFTLMNATGYVISHVYVSPSKENDWGDDILGKSSMDDDEVVPIVFSRKERTCDWDLKVTYEDDNSSVIWRGFDLCKVTKITIKYNRKTDTTSAIWE